jgi:hypothetical protein
MRHLTSRILLVSVFFWSFHLAAQTVGVGAKKEVPFFDLDISGSTGNYNGQSYSEVHVGLNMNFTDWLTWRNAAFKRFSSGSAQDVTGLDSGLRLSLNTPFDGGGLRFFAGPGYRWADPSNNNAAFAEAGLNIQVGRFSVGGGAKYLRYDRTQTDSAGNPLKKDDMNYFITLSGGAGLTF